MNDVARESLFISHPRLRKQWKIVENSMNNKEPAKKKRASSKKKAVEVSNNDVSYERDFMWKLINDFKSYLATITNDSGMFILLIFLIWILILIIFIYLFFFLLKKTKDSYDILYCERFIDWIIDLLAQLPTRRFFKKLLEHSFLLPAINLSELVKSQKGELFQAIVEKLEYYYFFEVDEFSGSALTTDEITERHYERIQHLQVIAYKFFSPTLRAFALRNVASIENRKNLSSNLSILSSEQIKDLSVRLGLINEKDNISSDILLESIILMHESRPPRLEGLIDMPIYPNEDIMWNEELKSSIDIFGLRCMALPKLNLQFLSIHDYLYRNFTLYQLNSAKELKDDLEDVIRRMAPRLSNDGSKTEFTGWARMSAQIEDFSMDEVVKPNLGQTAPSLVTSKVSVNLGTMSPEIQSEWKSIHQNDILFLVKISSNVPRDSSPDKNLPFPEAFGIVSVRGCQVEKVFDGKGNEIGIDGTIIARKQDDDKQKRRRNFIRDPNRPDYSDKQYRIDPTIQKRTFKVSLDANQYYVDIREDKDFLYEDKNRRR